MTIMILSPESPPARRRHGPWRRLTCALMAVAGMALWQESADSAENATLIDPPAEDEAPGTNHAETAVVAGGCFWGVQGVFEHVRGVQRAVAGYAGGAADTAHYETVGGGGTGHAESVEITFDPTEVSYGTLLRIFFSVAHDPTELNRQGPDSGTQYRSAIFPATPEQKRIAQSYIGQLDRSHAFGMPLATRVEDGTRFYPAEDYHQDFLARYPDYPYIVVNDLPKIERLRRLFPDLYRERPVLVKPAT